MNFFTGINYLTIGGAQRPAKFGTNQTAIYCQLRNIELDQYNVDWTNTLKGKTDGSQVRDLLYSALAAGCVSAKVPCDFDNLEVGDWIDAADAGEIKRFFDLLITQISPNVKRAKTNEKLKTAEAA